MEVGLEIDLIILDLRKRKVLNFGTAYLNKIINIIGIKNKKRVSKTELWNFSLPSLIVHGVCIYSTNIELSSESAVVCAWDEKCCLSRHLGLQSLLFAVGLWTHGWGANLGVRVY